MKLLYAILTLVSPCRNCPDFVACFFCKHKNWRMYRSKKTWEYVEEDMEEE